MGHNWGVDETDQQGVQERPGCGLLRLFCVSGGVLLIYVLSTGPVLKFCPPASQTQIVNSFYMPLDVLASKVPVAGIFFWWYLDDVWRVHGA